MNKSIRVFLKIIVFFLIWMIGWTIGFYIQVTTERATSGPFAFGSPIIAYYLCFSKWANENIWKMVDEKITKIFLNNNSISTRKKIIDESEDFSYEKVYEKCIENYWNVDDRASRTEFIAFGVIVYVPLFIFIHLINRYNFPEWTNAIYGIWCIFHVIPLFAVTLRRMLDVGITRWWGLCLLMPPVNFILILVLCFKPSK